MLPEIPIAIARSRSPADSARAEHAAAFVIYIAASVLLFGRGVLADPRNSYIGNGPDPAQFMWYLVWWPWAILHGLNPIYTRMVWAPTGYNLAWATSIGAPSLAAAPITFALGPVAAYNVLALLAPALTAWSGYLLCSHLTRAWWPSVAGGYVLGFSTYEIGHVAAGQLQLTLFFIPPLLVLLALMYLGGTLHARNFLLLFTSAVVIEFMTSTEVFATMIVCGAIALGLAMLADAGRRRDFIRLSALIAASFAACAVLVSPVLYWVFALGVPHEPIFPPAIFSADPIATLIPGPLTWLAPAGALAIARRFIVSSFPWESGVYIGLPLLAIATAFCVENRRQHAGKLVAGFLATVAVLSFGPVLRIAGRPSLPLPWAAASLLPLLDNVLPVRLMGFAFIAIAAAFALWLANAQASRVLKLVAALVCIVSIAPRPLPDSVSRVDTPDFFARGLYRRYLDRDANVLVVPYGRNGRSMLWQAQSDMHFRMAGGYLNLVPPDFRRWPILNTIYTETPAPDDAIQLKAFLAAKHVDAIVVADPAPTWSNLFSSLGVAPRAIGGVDLYDLRSVALGRPATPPAAELEASADAAWFPELIDAAGRYLAQGGRIDRLSPSALHDARLLPAARWFDNFEIVRAGWPLGLSNGFWVGPGRGGTIEIGLFGSAAAVRPLIETYGHDALATYYPYPSKFAERAAGDDDATHLLLMSFRADWIKGAALAKNREQLPASAMRISTAQH